MSAHTNYRQFSQSLTSLRGALTSRRRRSGQYAVFAVTLMASAGLWAQPALSQDATWDPSSGDYNTAANWTPSGVPAGTAIFDSNTIVILDITETTSVGGWTFNSGAGDYEFTIVSAFPTPTLIFTGAGIVVNDGSATINNDGFLSFNSSSSAGSATINNDGGGSFLNFNNSSTAGSAAITNSNLVRFSDTSSAGNANITNEVGGEVDFRESSSAGSATIINRANVSFSGSSTASSANITNDDVGTSLTFTGTSTAGSANITNDGSTHFNFNATAGSATITSGFQGSIDFNTNATAGSATINNNGVGSSLVFNENSTAGSATINNQANSSLINFNDNSSAGSATINNTVGGLTFTGTSTAASATINNNGAGSSLSFNDTSTAGSATITNTLGSILFFGASSAGKASITHSSASTLLFLGTSTAKNANIVNNTSLGFSSNSTGGQAQITTNGMGTTDFSFSTGPLGDGKLTAGSLAGAGSYILGANELTVGGNNLSTEVSGVISGAGGALIKEGAGTFTLSGTNTYTGPTTVDGGRLVVDGSILSEVTVNNGGTLGGTGQIGALIIGNGGTFAPGNSIGTQTVNGNFFIGSGATLEIETNAAGDSDKVVVMGTVNLTGATLSILPENGAYNPSTDYTIIDNDGTDAVVGTFAAITSSLAFLDPSVVYNGGTGNDVVLTLERNETMFSEVADTHNQRAVAGALDQFATDDALILAVLNQTEAGARQAFDALSGEIHATVGGVLADDSRYVRDAIMGRLMQAGHGDSSLGAAGPQMASLDQAAMALGNMALGYDDKSLAPPPSAPVAFWTAAYGAWGDYDGNRNAAGADRDLGGFMSGMDASIGDSWRVGLAAGASYSSIDVNGRNSSADVDSFTLAGYAGGMAGAFALRGGGAWAWNDIDTSRAVVFPGFFERQKASYDADTGQIFGEVAYPTNMGSMSVEPFAGLAYVSVDTDSFVERGGALASLRGHDTDQNVGYSTLGFRAATTTQWGGTMVTPHISAAWQHAFNDVTPDAALAFASNGIGFNVTGVPLAKNSALIDTGLDFALGSDMVAGLSYSGQFGDGVQDNAVKGRFTWLF